MDPEPLARRDAVGAVTRRAAALDALAHHGVVPVLTIERLPDVVGVGAALVAGGLPVVEITLRTAAGLPAIREVAASLPEILVGAGTVLDVDLAAAAVDAGARFIASPVFDEGVVAWCRAHDVLVLPGVTTPNEMMRAQRAGLDVVKFFPAAPAGGTAVLRAVSAVFEGLHYVPTGGIRAADLEEYLRIPTVVACGGSWMVDPSVLAARDWAVVEALARDAVEIARGARARRAGDPDA
jgi:2-dehydro-3-deoxyphosphogluconate aldolase / (4S)-4-hydroxy-2-oxoglutarate aldolase